MVAGEVAGLFYIDAGVLLSKLTNPRKAPSSCGVCESSNHTFVGHVKESCPHLPGVVPGDIRSGVQLCCGGTVEHQSLAL